MPNASQAFATRHQSCAQNIHWRRIVGHRIARYGNTTAVEAIELSTMLLGRCECNRSRSQTTMQLHILGAHITRQNDVKTIDIRNRSPEDSEGLLGTTLLKGRRLSKPLMRINHGQRAVVASGGACSLDNIGDFDKSELSMLRSLAVMIESKLHLALHSLESDITLKEDKSAKHARDISLVPAQCSLCSLHSYSGKISSGPGCLRPQNRSVSPHKAVDRA
jgi:hypothetical protein